MSYLLGLGLDKIVSNPIVISVGKGTQMTADNLRVGVVVADDADAKCARNFTRLGSNLEGK